MCKMRLGVFLGFKGAQEESKDYSWSVKGALCRNKVYNVVKCVVLGL